MQSPDHAQRVEFWRLLRLLLVEASPIDVRARNAAMDAAIRKTMAFIAVELLLI